MIRKFDVPRYVLLATGIVLLAGCNTPHKPAQTLLQPSQPLQVAPDSKKTSKTCARGSVHYCDHRKAGPNRCGCVDADLFTL